MGAWGPIIHTFSFTPQIPAAEANGLPPKCPSGSQDLSHSIPVRAGSDRIWDRICYNPPHATFISLAIILLAGTDPMLKAANS